MFARLRQCRGRFAIFGRAVFTRSATPNQPFVKLFGLTRPSEGSPASAAPLCVCASERASECAATNSARRAFLLAAAGRKLVPIRHFATTNLQRPRRSLATLARAPFRRPPQFRHKLDKGVRPTGEPTRTGDKRVTSRRLHSPPRPRGSASSDAPVPAAAQPHNSVAFASPPSPLFS